jgi:lysophospholipase L1-like esterase
MRFTMPFSADHSVQVNGSANGAFINTGKTQDVNFQTVVGAELTSLDPQKQILKKDLQEIQTLIQQLRQRNPQASQAEAQMFVTAITPKPVQERLLAAFAAGGRTAIAEFLDNAYVNIALAIIEGWRG